MKFSKTSLADAVLIELERRADERGFFARTFCAEEFAQPAARDRLPPGEPLGKRPAGTLRGMHFQRAPHGEVKLVRCVQGAIHDVIIDMRPGEPELSAVGGVRPDAANGRMLYVPAGFAHGFQTLEDDTDVTYQVSHPYTPGAEGGLRWDDPPFGIAWPLPVARSRRRTRPGPCGSAPQWP